MGAGRNVCSGSGGKPQKIPRKHNKSLKNLAKRTPPGGKMQKGTPYILTSSAVIVIVFNISVVK